MNTTELEASMGIVTKVVDQYSQGDVYRISLHVYGPSDVPDALKQQRAEMRALETVNITDGTVEDIESHFTDSRPEEFLTQDGHKVFRFGENDGDWMQQQIPDQLLKRDDITNDSIEILAVEYTLDKSDVENVLN